MKAYVISLKDKDNQLIEQLLKYNLIPIWVSGVNGKEVIKKNNKDIKNLFDPNFYKFATPHAIGCALSHLNIWSTILQQDEEYSIVFEDDVVFTENFNEYLPYVIQSAPKDFDILFLGCFACNGKNNIVNKSLQIFNYNGTNGSRKFKKINEWINIPRNVLGTHSYIISKKGCKRLINLLLSNRISAPIDNCINGFFVNKKIDIYVSNPVLVYQTSSNNHDNTKFPIIFNKILSNFYIEDSLRYDYIFNTVLYKIGSVEITPVIILVFLLGIFLRVLNNSDKYIFNIILIYWILHFIDLFWIKNWKNVILYFIVLMMPFFIEKRYLKTNIKNLD